MSTNVQKLITKEKLSIRAIIILVIIGLMVFFTRDTNVKYPSYKLGETIELKGKRSNYQAKGWSRPEEWGTWTEGESAALVMGVNSKKDLLLHINIAWVFNNNPVDIFVNDKFIDSFIFDAGDNVINIPKEYYPNKQLNIVFEIKDLKSPKDLGQSEDTRKIGMGIISFYIE
jgi:hypothetical protein